MKVINYFLGVLLSYPMQLSSIIEGLSEWLSWNATLGRFCSQPVMVYDCSTRVQKLKLLGACKPYQCSNENTRYFSFDTWLLARAGCQWIGNSCKYTSEYCESCRKQITGSCQSYARARNAFTKASAFSIPDSC